MNNMLSEALREYTGLLNQLMTNLLGDGAEEWGREFKRFLRKETCWTKRFTDNGDGTLSFTLPPTDGTTGEQWVVRTEAKGNRVGDWAKKALRSASFKPTTGVVYKVTVLKGELFSDSDRITRNIRAEAAKRKLPDLNAEAACLIRENFTDEELKDMGLWWIIVMHEPIAVDGGLELLGANRGGDGQWLNGYYDDPGYRWYREHGFAFAQALGAGI